MFQEPITPTPKLQPPGAGLPPIELFAARVLVGLKLRMTSQLQASEVFADETRRILSLIEGFDSDLQRQRVLIKRLRGMEDSSRYWSIAMTADHLVRVNRVTIDVIQSLMNGIKPQFTASTAEVKPSEDTDKSIVPIFRSVCEEFEKDFPSTTLFPEHPTFCHPWFGELKARQWHFFAGFHMRLHRRQIELILKSLGQRS